MKRIKPIPKEIVVERIGTLGTPKPIATQLNEYAATCVAPYREMVNLQHQYIELLETALNLQDKEFKSFQSKIKQQRRYLK